MPFSRWILHQIEYIYRLIYAATIVAASENWTLSYEMDIYQLLKSNGNTCLNTGIKGYLDETKFMFDLLSGNKVDLWSNNNF